MTVTVLLFASYADAFGRQSLTLGVDDGATVADVLDQIAMLPGGERLPSSPLIAVNECYANRDQALMSGDELAIIPPVAGG
jgi:molybdopterin converting factor small subunit